MIKNLTITRKFNASSEKVWKAWTEPKRLKRWWGPKYFTTPVCKMDLKPKGKLRIDMKGPDGAIYPMIGVFQKVVKNKLLVFTNIPLDNKGKSLFKILSTIKFSEKNGKATLVMNAKVLKAGKQAAPYLSGMKQGWTQSLDKLAKYVRKA